MTDTERMAKLERLLRMARDELWVLDAILEMNTTRLRRKHTQNVVAKIDAVLGE